MSKSVNLITIFLLSAVALLAWAVSASGPVVSKTQPELRVKVNTAGPLKSAPAPKSSGVAAGTSLSQAPISPTARQSPKAKPRPRPWAKSEPLDLPVKAWLALYVSPQGEQRVLTAHNADQAYPIASLTKLVTAIVAHREIKPETKLIFNPTLESLGGDQAATSTAGQPLVSPTDLLFPLLIESNNDAASTLANSLPPGQFVTEMNELATELGMVQTHFVNPHGLDPSDDSTPNQASARDLIRLAEAYRRNYPGLLNITKQKQFALWAADGSLVRRFVNTNKLINASDWPAEVVGGKTGYTDLADRNLLLVLRDKKSGGYLYTVVLGTNNHFAATTDLLDWVYYNHQF